MKKALLYVAIAIAVTAMGVSLAVGVLGGIPRDKAKPIDANSEIQTCEDFRYQAVVNPGLVNKYASDKIIDLMIADGRIKANSDRKAMIASLSDEHIETAGTLAELCKSQPNSNMGEIIGDLYRSEFPPN